MKHGDKKIIIAILTLVLLSLAPIQVKSGFETGFSVEPAIFNLEISRGKGVQKTIRIKNTGGAPVPAVINLRDLSFDNFRAKDNGRASLADWIQIKNSYFILNPGETKEMFFSIAVPKDAEYRSYWSFFTIEPQIANGKDGDVRTVAMVGIPMLLAVVPEDGSRVASGGLTIAQMELSDSARVRFLEKFVNRVLDIKTTLAGAKSGPPAGGGGGVLIVEKDPYDFNIKLKNAGDYHYSARGAIGLYDSGNKLVASADMDTKTILPGEEKKYPLRMNLENSAIFPGKYRADINLLAYNGGADAGQKVEKTLEFWIFPWKKILFYALFILLFFPVVSVFFFHRRRFFSAARILFGGKSLCASEYRVKKEKAEIENVYSLLPKKNPAPFSSIVGGKRCGKRSAIPKAILGASNCVGRKHGFWLTQKMKGGEKI